MKIVGHDIMNSWFVYIVSCSDGSFYTGITTDTKKRVLAHNNKKGAKSLFGKLPVKLIFSEKHENRSIASKREIEIKAWSHFKKAAFVRK